MTTLADSINVGGRDFEIKCVLGKGGFSTVLKAIDKATNKKVALKITFTDAYKNQVQKQVSMHQIHKEIKVMRSLQEDNIIRLLGYDLKSIYDGRTCIVMVQELAPRRELFEYLMHSGTFQEELARTVFKQLLAGLGVLHSKGITHRDLKPENLLFDNNFTLKIADFGFACAFEKAGQQKVVKTVLGTRGYMAPEIAHNQPYNEKVDIFASGVILFILMSGFPPFRETRSTDWWWNKICKGKTELFWLAHQRKAKHLENATLVKDLITKMIAVDPNNRPSCTEIMAHDWTNGNALGKTDFRTEMKRRLDQVNQARLDKKVSRDVLADVLNEMLDDLPKSELLSVRELIINNYRQSFLKAETASDVNKNLRAIAKVSNRLAGIIDSFEWAQNVDQVEAANELGRATDVEDVQNLTNLDEDSAEKILNCISSICLQYEDYNHANTDTFLQLDQMELSPLPENHNALGAYEIRCGFGMVCLSLQLFADRHQGTLEIQPDDRKATVSFDMEETEDIPIDETGENFQEVSVESSLTIEVTLYSQENSAENVVVFNNSTEGIDKYVTQGAYKDFVTELITETGIGACYTGAVKSNDE